MHRYLYLRLRACRTCVRLILALGIFPAFAGAQSAKPSILKIDPPNWFSGLPNSLLLVHGEHLEATTFAIKGCAGRITETTPSPNGHWAFLGFDSASTVPGTCTLIAANAKGSTSVPYTISALRTSAEQPRGFSNADTMYLIMPDRFANGDTANDNPPGYRAPSDRSVARAYHGGDLKGIQDHLAYLRQLGVTTIWTTPLYDNSAAQSGQTYHGYSATDLYAVDPHFGSMADLQALVRAAHAMGMKFVLDTVPNHVGAAHPWTRDEPTPDWFHGTPASHVEAQFDFSSIVDPKGSVITRNAVLNGWFANALPDMDQEQPLVAVYLIQNAIWWIEEAGLDGLRIDTFPFVPRSFWNKYNGLLHTLYPHLTEVGEIFSGDPKITSFFAGGRAHVGSDGTFDTQLYTPFDYPMFFALRGALTGKKPMSAIADILAQDTLYPHPERLVTFLDNHDNKRFLSEPGATPAALRLGFGLLATLRGMPELYYGDEVDMTGGDDPDNRRDFPGGFPGDRGDAFIAQEQTKPQREMHDWVQTLFRLRAITPVLQSGGQATLLSDATTLAYVRADHLDSDCTSARTNERYLIVAQSTERPAEIRLPIASTALAGCSKFTSVLRDGAHAELVDGALQTTPGTERIAIFRVQP